MSVFTLIYLHDGDVEVALFSTKSIAIEHAIARIQDEIFSVQDKKIKIALKEIIATGNFIKALDIWHLYQNSLSDSRIFKFLELNVKNA